MAASDDMRLVGIMAQESEGYPPFGERQFYARLCRLGRAFGLTVYVFSPLRIDPVSRMAKGYTYVSESAGWEENWYPLPDLIYDRAFFARQRDYTRFRAAVRRLHTLKPIPYLGHGLKSKWEMLAFLRRDPELRPYLPRTAKLVRAEKILEWLDHNDRVFLKPQSGSHGKGTALVRKQSSGFQICARDSQNRPLELSFERSGDMLAWLRGFIGHRSYLIQQYLELQSSEGSTWDIRSLVQKNGRGLWELTGMAVRVGLPGSITSNIHGGGAAAEVGPFLEKQYGPKQADAIMKHLLFLSAQVPPALEASNGRMAELGLDLGVDRNGRVWIIEVNTKPGRSVFSRLSQGQNADKAARNPMAYASHLLRRSAPLPGSRAAAN